LDIRNSEKHGKTDENINGMMGFKECNNDYTKGIIQVLSSSRRTRKFYTSICNCKQDN